MRRLKQDFVDKIDIAALPPAAPVHEKPEKYQVFTDVLKSPTICLAPMVHKSETSYRRWLRHRGFCDIGWTPMISTSSFDMQKDILPQTHHILGAIPLEQIEARPSTDCPCVIQLSGSSLPLLLKSVRHLAPLGDAFCINFGCPQRIASRGMYGAYLSTEWALCQQIVRTIHEASPIPVLAKIRIFGNVATTIAFCRMLVQAGAQAITIHARVRNDRSNSKPPDYDHVAAVIRSIPEVPFIINGGIHTRQMADDAIAKTGAVAAMVGTALLRNPTLQPLESITPEGQLELALDYLNYARQLEEEGIYQVFRVVRVHVVDLIGLLLFPSWWGKFNVENPPPPHELGLEWNKRLGKCENFDEISQLLIEIRDTISETVE